MWFDLALEYDPVTRRCDLACGEDGDLTVDETSITATILSAGLDRRAAPDDVLPAGRGDLLVPDTLVARRGWAGDALDPAGERAGSRLWLADRMKETEATRLMVRFWLAESLAWAPAVTGRAAEVDAQWLREETLFWRAMVGEDEVSMTRRTG